MKPIYDLRYTIYDPRSYAQIISAFSLSAFRFLFCLTLALSLQPSAFAQTTSVLFPINTLFGGAAYNQPITITAANTLVSDGQNLWAGTYTVLPACTNSQVVNLYPNTYLMTVAGVVKPVRFTVPASTNVLDVTGLITSGPLFYLSGSGLANLTPGSGIAFATNGDGSLSLSNTLPAPAGTLTNLPAAVVMNPAFDASVFNFFLANSIYDAPAQSRVLNGVGVLKSFGAYSNLTDWILLKPGLGASNKLSFFGRRLGETNITFSSWGAHFSNSVLTLPAGVDLRTNTLVITWRIPLADNAVSQGNNAYLFGVANPATGSAIWRGPWVGHYEQFFQQAGTNLWPNNHGSAYTNLINMFGPNLGGAYGYGRIASQPFERRVSVLSAAGPVMSAYDNGRPDALTINANLFFQTSSVVVTDPLTNVVVGALLNTNQAYPFATFTPFQGEVDSVLIFNTAASSNLVVAATLAARCLEPEPTDDVWIGDSLNSAPPTGNFWGTNNPCWFIEQRGPVPNNCWVNESIGGTKWSSTWSTMAASNLLFGLPTAPGITRRVFAGAGINDLYGDGNSATAIFGYIATLANWCALNNAKLIIEDVQPIWTNCSVYGYNLFAETNRVTLNNLIATNTALFSGIIKRGAVVNQAMMNTNNPLPFRFSVDGLHFGDPTNGWMANKIIADSWMGEGDSGFRPLRDWTGNLLIPGNLVTNWTGYGQ